MTKPNVKINKDFKLAEDYTVNQKLEQDESRMQDRPKVGVPIFNPDPSATSSQKYLSGPIGPRGEKGEKGDNGSLGPRGLPGERGPKGEQGLRGEQGLPGPKGLTGSIGNNGPKGDKGEQGLRGERGLKGLQGLRGLPGPIGEQGVKGDNGAALEFSFDYVGGVFLKVRAVGSNEWVKSANLMGLTGAPGAKGDPGVKGDKGDKGVAGDGSNQISQEALTILGYFSIDANGNLVCSKKLGINKSVAAGAKESLAIEGYVNAKDYESGESSSIQEMLVPVVFDISPENIMVIEDATLVQRSLAAVFSAYQDTLDMSLLYTVSVSNPSAGLTVEVVGFEFIVTGMVSIDVGSFDVNIKTTSGIFVAKRRVNVYKLQTP